jgi:hypothetical protein
VDDKKLQKAVRSLKLVHPRKQTLSRRSKQLERTAGKGKPLASAVDAAARANWPVPVEAGPSLFAKPGVRAGVSVLLLLHLLAVFTAPLAARPNASAISRALVFWFQPYLDTAYLNHGYGFFSPDPGSSLIVRYEVELPDDTVKQGVLPDRNEHWPRLLYHRHFMLTSQSESLPGLPEAYARHLQHVFNAKRVKLQLVEHVPPSPASVLEGRTLTDPRSYIVRSEAILDEAGKFAARLVAPPAGEEIPPTSGGPTGERQPAPGVDAERASGEYRGPLAPRRPGSTEEQAR